MIASDLQYKKTALFLGAGAAIYNGFPLENRLPSGEMVKKLLLRYYYSVELSDGSKDQENLERFCSAKNLGDVKDLRPEEVWAKILEEKGSELTSHIHVLRRIFHDKKFIPPNYKFAARLLLQDFFTTILTTNFDEKLDDAISKVQSETGKRNQDVVLVASTADDFAHFGYGMKGTRIIYKLHGTLSKPYTIRSSREDVDQLSDSKDAIIKKIWDGSDWIFFVGYSGRDRDILRTLTNICTNPDYRKKVPTSGKIFWISLEHPRSDPLQRILEESNSLTNFEQVDGNIFFKMLQDVCLPKRSEIGGAPVGPEVVDFLKHYGPDSISSLKKRKSFEDPILGEIVFPDAFSSDITSLINTAEIQRLRDIKQLSFVHFRYPHATHSRFVHSIGVAYLVSRALGRLCTKSHLNLDENKTRTAVVSALLHDVGHGPFGHVIDTFDIRLRGTREYFHEKMIERFLKSGELDIRLDALPAARDEIRERAMGNSYTNDTLFISQLIAEYGLDFDRIEFLTRDSFFCNIESNLFGSFPRINVLEKILEAVDTFEAKEAGLSDYPSDSRLLCFRSDIKAIIEELQKLYIRLYRDVYHHEINLKAQAMIAKALNIAYDIGDLNPYEIHGFTDSELFTFLEAIEDPTVRKLAWAVKYRRFFEAVAVFSRGIIGTRSISDLEKEIMETCGIKGEDYESTLCVNLTRDKSHRFGEIFLKEGDRITRLDTSGCRKELAMLSKGYIFAPHNGQCWQKKDKIMDFLMQRQKEEDEKK